MLKPLKVRIKNLYLYFQPVSQYPSKKKTFKFNTNLDIFQRNHLRCQKCLLFSFLISYELLQFKFTFKLLYYINIEKINQIQLQELDNQKMIFTLPIIFSIIIAIFAIILILEPENIPKGAVQNKMMRNQFRSSKHKWQKSELKSFYFCYLCHKLTNGWFSDMLQCKKCGIIIHKICKYLKLRKPQCKYIVAKHQNSKFFHQWRQCTFSSSSNCLICETVCVGLQSYICIWCRRTKHGLCDAQNLQCDFGQMRKFILEPTQIKCQSINFTSNAFQSLKKSYKKIKQKTSQSEQDPQIEQEITFHLKDKLKRPVIVIINKKSGGQAGNQYIKAFYQLLNPLQVISILDQGLEKLKLFVSIPNLFFVIAGGDGTICSVINYIKQIPQWKDVNPPAAVLPLGTGNDLSRSLGWGGSTEQISPLELIKNYNKVGKTELLDRWKMKIQTPEDNNQQQEFTIYNYIGFGLDGKICKQFHQMRQKHPELFFSQFSNKLIYTQMGAFNFLKGNRIPLNELLSFKVDGNQLSIEDYENVILLNIKHWGGGVTGLWKKEQQGKFFEKQSFSDGKIEIIGLTDLIHMGQVQVGLDQPFQLAQAKIIQIETKKPNSIIPLQIDGEPMQLQSPFKIRIQRKDQAYVLTTQGSVNGRISKILSEAVKEKIINGDQLRMINQLAGTIPDK